MAYKMLLFFFENEVILLKEIGEKLRQTREEMGLSLEEVAEDLKLNPSQLKSIENGEREVLREIFNLKQLIRDYAKYLGLDYEKIEDEYGEFVFEITSKIPLDDIARASQEKQKEREQIKKIVSPYTLDHKTSISIFKIIICFLFFILLVIGYFMVKDLVNNEMSNEIILYN